MERCERCGLVKDDVVRQPDPYKAEMFDDKELYALCNDCVVNAKGDI